MDVPCLNKTNTRDSVLKITKTPEPTSGNTYPFFVFNPVPTAVPPCASCSSEAAISKNQKSGSKEVAEKVRNQILNGNLIHAWKGAQDSINTIFHLQLQCFINNDSKLTPFIYV